MTFISFLLALLGSNLLCYSMRRHYELLSSRTLTTTRVYLMRSAGYACLLGGAAVAVSASGMGIGLTLFTALFTVAMLSTVFGCTCLSRVR